MHKKVSGLAILTLILVLTLMGCSQNPLNENPTASFSADPTSGEAPLDVTFNASSSTAPDGREIVSYHWEFGDENSDTDDNDTTTHTYTDPGDYTVSLTVTDDLNNEDTTTAEIAVSTTENVPPSADIDANPTSGEAPLEVSFDASGSSDPDGKIESYYWDLGDGSTSGQESGTYTYSDQGEYTVTLTVTDDGGATDTASVTISVSPSTNQPPTANFTVSPESGEVPLEVDLDGSSSSDPDQNISSYSWDFGDGTEATGPVVTHTYYQTGNYTVELTVTDDEGANDSTTKSVSVTGTPPQTEKLAILNSTLTETIYDYATVTGKAKNVSGQNLSQAQIGVKFYNSTDERIARMYDMITDLGPDQVWNFEITAPVEFSEVERTEVFVSSAI